jgi:Leucine-rich repeat (LRR) protein
LPNIGGGDGSESELAQALELHAPEPRKTDKIEIKSEEWPQLDLTALNSYKNLINLNLSMNKIALIKGGIDCPLLQHLRLSDNVIKDIPPSLL